MSVPKLDIAQVQQELQELERVLIKRAEVFNKIAYKLGWEPEELANRLVDIWFECFGSDVGSMEKSAKGGKGGRGGGRGGGGFFSRFFNIGLTNVTSASVDTMKFLFLASILVPIIPALFAGKLIVETTTDDPKINDKLLGPMIQRAEFEKMVKELKEQEKREKKQKDTSLTGEGFEFQPTKMITL